MQPTYDQIVNAYDQLVEENQQLRQEHQQLRRENRELRALLEKALARIEYLEEQLGINSSNSSKPPSSDKKPNTKIEWRKPRKPRQGFFRQRISDDQVDQRVEYTLDQCPRCESQCLIKRRRPALYQQVELVERPFVVTNHLVHRYQCRGCGKKVRAEVPSEALQAFGSRLRGAMGCLTGAYHLSRRSVARLFSEMFGIRISVGTISHKEDEISSSLQDVYQEIGKRAREGPGHADETGWRNQGKNGFVWLLTSKDFAFFSIEASRSRQACKSLLGEEYQGPLVTDRYSAYSYLEIPHQWCFSHLLRDAKRISERKGIDGEVGSDLLIDLYATLSANQEYRAGLISQATFRRRIYRYKKSLRRSLVWGVTSGLQPKTQRFCNTLLTGFSHLCVFMKHPGIEPTNNLAERDLRSLVIWRKISFRTKSDRGCRFVERMTSVVTTLRKQNRPVFEFLIEALTAYQAGQPLATI